MRIIVIGAHPDDFELGMAGTIMKHVEAGDEVHAIIASAGEVIGLGEQRKKEAVNSSRFLGIKSTTFLNIPDTMITDGKPTIDKIERQIKRIMPDRIYTHSINDTHQDHRNLSRATLSAARRVKQVIFYESPSTDVHFEANFFVDIEKYIDKKIKCLLMFESLHKMGDRRYLEIDAIKGGAYFRGYQCNRKYAEAFKVFRYLED